VKYPGVHQLLMFRNFKKIDHTVTKSIWHQWWR